MNWGYRRFILGVAVAILGLAGATAGQATASDYRVLYTFCQNGPPCSDGDTQTGLVADASGNLFGTTILGGDANAGTIFELIRNSDGSAYKYKRLYSFCAQPECADGETPWASLIIDGSGNLYGTTQGGAHNLGTAFELVRTERKPKFKLLTSFCVVSPCTDARQPKSTLSYAGQSSGMAYDGTGPLYGTSSSGGDAGSGVVYALVQNSKGKWAEKVLYSFCAPENCTSGSGPATGVIVNASGELIGATQVGGTRNSGVVYKLAKTGKTWNEVVLYDFCSAKACADGTGPHALTMDLSGNVFGTTIGGGGKIGAGTVFEIPSDGSGYRVLHQFCPDNRTCPDGQRPWSLISDATGNLFGTTERGGSSGHGVLFAISAGTFNVLYTFCLADNTCSDGRTPLAPPMIGASGHLFGTTLEGNYSLNTNGVVYEFTP